MPNNYDSEYQKSIAMSAAQERVAQLQAKLADTNPQPISGPTKAPVQEVSKPEEDLGFLGDVGAFFKELPEQFVGGVNDAINNTVEVARDAGKALGIPNHALQYKNEKGEWDWKILSEQEVAEKGGLDKVLPEFDQASTAGGNMLRAITTFATGFIPAAKGVKALGVAGNVAKGLIAGGVADAVTMDPHQERLATFLNEVPALGAIIPDYIADNNPENEGNWEGRIKNVIEGAVLGGASEMLIGSAVKMFKGYKVASAAKKMAGGAGPLTPEDALKQMDELSKAKAAATEEFASQQLPPKMSAEDFAKESEKAATQGKVYINMDHLDTTDPAKELLQKAADMQASKINAGNTTFKEISAASEAEMTDLNKLLARPTDRPMSAPEVHAAKQVLLTSTENLTELGRIASLPSATSVDLYNFKKAWALHDDIQVKVFGGQKATAQAVASMRMTVKSDAGRLKAIKEFMAEGQNVDIQKTAIALTQISDTAGLEAASAAAGKMASGKWMDAHYQVWINGLLSAPSTHGANIISNVGTTLMAIPERYVTAGFEMMTGANSSALVEANARATGLMNGIVDGFQMMTGKMEKPASIASSKFDRHVPAISAAAWGKQPDSIIGKGLDYLGKAIGMPSWALEKSDDFFKGMNYRMMLQEKAAKQAATEGLTGQAFKTRMADLVNNPTEAMSDVAGDFARYQTFTSEAGDLTKKVQATINATPGGKYVMPFVRTPSNILAYGFERTPLALASSAVRADIKAGGSKGAAALAKISCGTILMAGASKLTLDGKITGGGPTNWDERRALEATGWKPYSIKAGDKYISYERLEPIGSLLAYSADITSIMGQTESSESEQLVAAGLAAFAKNLTNKTFTSGIAKFVDMVNSGDPKKIEKYVQSMGAGLLQPVYSSAVKKTNNYFDDVKRDYTPESEESFLRSIVKQAAENVPGMGTDAPPMRDVWGEVQHYSDGIASPIDVMSPIALGTDKNDPVSNMIADNRIALTRPERSMNGVKLNNKQYSEFCEIAGKEAKKQLDEAYSSGLFDGMSGGPDGEKALVIQKIITGSRKYAKGEMIMNNPDLEESMFQVKMDKESKLMGDK